MSRAFVRERDDPEPRLPVGDPRPITAAGYARLRERLALEDRAERRAALEATLAEVYVVAPPATGRSRVAFGATVRVSGGAEAERTFTIVGEDEIDVERGRIGAASPLAQALLGKRVGARAMWERPAGRKTIRVLEIRFEE